MKRSAWMILILGGCVLALAVMGACRESGPTPTPIPTPTPEPVPTPAPTSIERLNRQVSWLDAPPDVAHWIARTAIRRIAVQDEALGQEIAALPWSVDGVTADEAGALDDLSWLLQQDSAVATVVLDFQWMREAGVINADERRAVRAVRAATDVDADFGSTLASYPWIADSIAPEEADALDALAELVAPDFQAQTVTGIGAMRLAPPSPAEPPRIEFVREFAEVVWLQDEIAKVETEALDAWRELIQVEGQSGAVAIETLWGYDWARDDATTPEVTFIEGLFEVVQPADDRHADAVERLLSYDWVRNGIAQSERGWIDRYAPLFEDAGPEDADALATVLDYAWVADGLESTESRGIQSLSSLFPDSFQDDSQVLLTILSYPWVADSLDGIEIEVVDEFGWFLFVTRDADSTHRQTIVEYSWLSDDVTMDELGGFAQLSVIMQALGSDYPDALDSVLAYDWLRDDFVETDADSLSILHSIFGQLSLETDEFIVALASRPWIQDGVRENERNLLVNFEHFLTGELPFGVAMPPHLATYPWLDDGIAEIESRYVREALQLIRNVSPIAPETVDTLIEGTHLDSPQEFEDEIFSFQGFNAAINASDELYGELVNAVAHLPWLSDGLIRIEGWWLHEYAAFLRELNGEHGDLAQSVPERPWARDGISADEREWMHQYRRLLEQSDSTARTIALDLATLSRFHDGIDHFDASVVARLAATKVLQAPEINGQDWFRDGISNRDLVILMAYIDALARSRHQYEDLVSEFHVAERTLELPLAGEIELFVVGHTEFPQDDPTLDLMEEIAVQLEHFMGVPFPLDIALILYIEPNLEAGEEPEHGVAGSLGSHIVAAPPRYNPDFHLAVFHEMSHLYWGGHTGAPPWWTEGTAGFLPDYARHVLGHEDIEIRLNNLRNDTRRECWNHGVNNISDYYRLQRTDPRFAADRGICVFALGEIFLVEMYRLLGFEATSAALRQIYLDSRNTGWLAPVTDQRVYDAFLANVPEDKMEDFQGLFDRLHGGSRVTLQETGTT